jgi:hypothetical protein
LQSLQDWLALVDGGLLTEQKLAGKEMMNKSHIGVLFVMQRLILGFIVASVLGGCVTTQPYDIGQTPNQDSISDFIMRWDKLDRTHATKEEYRQLYGQTLKALSRAMEEAERYKSRSEAP